MNSRSRGNLPAPLPKAAKYKLEFLESALREWGALDGSVRSNFKKLLASRLESPHVPGSELHGPLASCYKIKLRSQGYRLVYTVRDDVLVVLVIAIDRRDKDRVYQVALARVQDMIEKAKGEGRATKGSRRR